MRKCCRNLSSRDACKRHLKGFHLTHKTASDRLPESSTFNREETWVNLLLVNILSQVSGSSL